MPSLPNVLLLVVDSLRFDVLFDEATTTPTIDGLVDDGITFSQCISQGISTAPAMTALLTGRLPLDYGGHWYLEDGQPTFAEEFRNAGYTTCAVHSNPYVSSRRNFDRGFDYFEEDVVAFEPDRTLERAPEKLLRLLSRVSRLVSKTPYTPAETVNEQVLDAVDGTDGPWFCWAQYMDVHGPYLPGGDVTYRNKFRAEWLWRKAAVNSPDGVTKAEHEELWRNYEREVEYIDEQFGALFDALDAREKLDNTVIVVTADHGDEFYEHGRYGHGNLPYDELTNVPLVVSFPDASHDQTEVSEMVRAVDVLPTILDHLDVDVSDVMSERMVGTSLLPLVCDSGSDNEIEQAVTEKRVRDTDALRIGLRTGRWKFLYDGTTDETALYDLQADPAEQTDVSDDNPEIAARFQDDLDARFTRIDETTESVDVPTPDVDAGTEERLRALGYKD